MKNNFRIISAAASTALLVSMLAPAPQAVAASSATGVNSLAAPTLMTAVSGRGHRLSTATRSSLTRLEQSLTWKQSAGATYKAVVPRAEQALKALDRQIRLAPESVPNHATYRDALSRLVIESTYLSERTGDENFEYGVLDSEMFLKGAVAEWQHMISRMNLGLNDPAPAPGTYVGTLASVSQQTAPGTVFADRVGGPSMVVIPAGSYLAGSTDAEHEEWDVPEARRDFELPQREVTIDYRFAISQTEVTVDQFQAFVEDTGYRVRGGARWWNPDNPEAMVFNSELDYLNPGFKQTGDSPVVAITREDAQAYVEWLSETTGENYRLPTEDEWEWAARGGADTTFFWGNELEQVNLYANSYDLTSAAANGFDWDNTGVTDGYAHTAPVGSFEPNAFGVYDVTGNAREFTADNWVRDLSDEASDGSAHEGPIPFPVLRGGAWNYQPQNLRIDYRSAYFSSETATNMFGFRVVRDLG